MPKAQYIEKKQTKIALEKMDTLESQKNCYGL